MTFITSYPQYVTLIIFVIFSIPIIIYDTKTMFIPDILFYTGGLSLLLYRFACTRNDFLIYFLTAVISVLLFIIIRLCSKKGLGKGDIKYGAVCALYAGPAVLFAGFLISSLSGLIYYFIMKKLKKAGKSTKFAFTPFLFLGTLVTGLLPLFN